MTSWYVREVLKWSTGLKGTIIGLSSLLPNDFREELRCVNVAEKKMLDFSFFSV